MLTVSPADTTQRTDSLGLELNANALPQGGIREQFGEHASILKVLRLAKRKDKKVENAHVHSLVKNFKSTKYLSCRKQQFLTPVRNISVNYERQFRMNN